MHNFSKEIAIVIPSLNPDENMVNYVKELVDYFEHIIIVDDGSDSDTKFYFDKVREYEAVTVLVHDTNKGKGRALKTGFQYVLDTFHADNMVGVVTADADGQHSVQDTVKVAKELWESQTVILGTRDFNAEIVPFKSRNGNKITTVVFALLYGKRINDTQTGLRGIPFTYLPRCVELPGEKFEYEIRMLIDIVRLKQQMQEVEIETIYINSNRATHFHAIKDSLRIYGVIFKMFFKFAISGVVSFGVDIGLFAFFTKTIFKMLTVSQNVFWGTVIARLISSILNFQMNKKIVFDSKIEGTRQAFKYFILCVVQLLCSWLLVVGVYNRVHFDTSIIKIMVDLCLFFVSFQIQQRWVFREKY